MVQFIFLSTFLSVTLALLLGMTSGLKTNSAEASRDNTRHNPGLSPDIAFSATRRFAFELHTHKLHKPITFETMEFNQGGDFNPQTGYFTAPVVGLYVFNYKSYKSNTRKVRLMKNMFEIQALSLDGKGKERNMEGRNILLQLDQGDKIWLLLTHGKQQGSGPLDNSTTTTFSGYLMTTQVHNDDHLDIKGISKRRKRSTENRMSLERKIRDLHALPLTMMPRGESEADEHSSAPAAITSNAKVAFSVTCTKSMIGGHMTDTTINLNGHMNPEESPDGRISFDKTLVNLGGSFDIAAGEFRAPTSGVYFFAFNVGKYPRKKLSVMLMKNLNEVQSIIYNDSKTRAREIQGQSLMLELKQNDRVWLRSYNNDEYAVYSNLGNYITFNGYLVYEL